MIAIRAIKQQFFVARELGGGEPIRSSGRPLDWESFTSPDRRRYNVDDFCNANVFAVIIPDGIGRPEVDNVIDSIGVGSAEPHTAVAGRPDRALANRAVDSVCQ